MHDGGGTMTPSARYRAGVASGDWGDDPAQREALRALDRIHDALQKGEKITAGGIELSLEKPEWARFLFPGEPGFGA